MGSVEDSAANLDGEQAGSGSTSDMGSGSGPVDRPEDELGAANVPSKPKRRKHKMGVGRRIQRLLGYCRFCNIELERNSTNPRKCDGGGMGSILGNVVLMAGVFAMLVSVLVRKFETRLFDDSQESDRMKLVIRDGGMLMLVAGILCERWTRDLQASCCCKCAKVHQDVSYYCRRTCYFCNKRLIARLNTIKQQAGGNGGAGGGGGKGGGGEGGGGDVAVKQPSGATKQHAD
jgi:hypothetical protein